MASKIQFSDMMLEPGNASIDLRDNALRIQGQDLARRLEAKKAIAWQLCFRKYFRPLIRATWSPM